MQEKAKNLSDTRGNRFGIGFFLLCLRLFGPKFCCIFVWFVAPFYALFDKQAFAAAAPYLRSRFPNASPLKLRWHFCRQCVSQGQVMILAHWIRTGHQVKVLDVNAQNGADLINHAPTGFILLLSHAGCWQATITRLENLDRPVHLLIQANLNENVAKLFKGKQIDVISNEAAFGGLLDCMAALEKHEIVCIMGDRMPPDAENALHLTLHGRTVSIPAAPWLLAARCHKPIFPVFTMMTGLASGIDYIFEQKIELDYDLPRKPKPEQLQPLVEPYEDALNRLIDRYPYQIFHYQIH